MSVSIVQLPKKSKKEMYMTDKELAKKYRGSDSEKNTRPIREITSALENMAELNDAVLYIAGRVTNVYVFEEYVKFKERNKHKPRKEPISKFIEGLDL